MPEATPTGGSVRDDGRIDIPNSSVPSIIRDSPHPTQTHTLKRGEEEVEVTTDKLIEMAQKGWNADVVTQQARETIKEYSRDHILAEDLKAVIAAGDVDAFRRMGAACGVSGTEVEAAAVSIWGGGREVDEDVEEEEGEVQPTKGRKAAPNTGKLNFNQFPEEVQRLLLEAEKGRIDRIIDAALDKSEKVRYNVEQYDAKGQKAIRALVEEKVRGRLAASSGDFGDGSHILREVLPEVELLLEALGSPRRGVAALGMGNAPGGGDLEVYPKKMPDHVSSQDGGFDQSIFETIAHNHRKINESSR